MTSTFARAARRFKGADGLPVLFAFVDPDRTPDALALARRLPPGAALVFRHFGRPDMVRQAGPLAALCRRRGVVLLVGRDARLAARLKVGLHLPERARMRPGVAKRRFALVTAAVHGRAGLAHAAVADAIILSPIYPTRSASARVPLGLGSARRLIKMARAPVIALGGVAPGDAVALAKAGFAGMAGVDLFYGPAQRRAERA